MFNFISDFLILTSRSDYTVFSNLTFRNVSKHFNERYVDCEVENSPDNVPNSKVDPMYLNVKGKLYTGRYIHHLIHCCILLPGHGT